MRWFVLFILVAGCTQAPSDADVYDPYEEEPEHPTLALAKNGPDHKLVVWDVDEGVRWSDLKTTGCKEPSKSLVEIDDELTDCHGQVRIIHSPTNALLYESTFT